MKFSCDAQNIASWTGVRGYLPLFMWAACVVLFVPCFTQIVYGIRTAHTRQCFCLAVLTEVPAGAPRGHVGGDLVVDDLVLLAARLLHEQRLLRIRLHAPQVGLGLTSM